MNTSAEALHQPEVGEVVGEGRFELVRKLGEGGMSMVFLATDRLLGREVALKLLIPRYVGRPEREQRLINEADYLRRVGGHPNVVEFIDSGRLRDRNDWPWLSTEVLRGEDLGWLGIRGKVEVPQIVSIARQTALALAACHEAGIVHRDVTPSNVFLLEDQRTIKLFDFGLAAELHAPEDSEGSERLTGFFEIPGTAGYMGPEQVFNAAPDVGMDVFGFGMLLFRLVTGRDAYHQFSDREAFIRAQREGALEPPRVHAWAYGVPEALADLVHDCTQRDTSKRPSMAEVVARLDAIAESIGAVVPSPPMQAAPAEPTLPEPRRPAARGLFVMAGVLLIAGVGLVVAWSAVDLGGPATVELDGEEHSYPNTAEQHPTPAPTHEPAIDDTTETGSGTETGTHLAPMHEPEAGTEFEAESQPQPKPKPKLGSDPACDGVEADARAALQSRKWATVIELTQRKSCWSSKDERVRLRVRALLSSRRNEECIKAGRGSRDPEVLSMVKTCEALVNRGKP